MVEKLFLHSFLKNQNWAYLLMNSVKCYTICFHCMPKWGLSKYIEKLSCKPFAFTSYKIKKTKRSLELVSLPHFIQNFWRKYFCFHALLTDQISLPGCLYFVRCWALCVLQLFVKQVVTSKTLKITLSFESSRLSYMTKKSRQKFKFLVKEKSF